jgi:hypothetical protein
MPLESVLTQLGGLAPIDDVRAHWEESVAALPEMPPFLDAAEFTVSREWAGIEPEADAVLIETARRILANPALKLLAWHGYRRLYDWPDSGGFGRWPTLEGALGDLSGCFYLLIGLGMVPKVRARHREMGVHESVTRETFGQLWSGILNYRMGGGGRFGLYSAPLSWLRHYVAGRLFRLGRFEYKLEPHRPGHRVYRHRATGCTLVLAADGARFTPEGLGDFSDRPETHADLWTASLHDGGATVTGFPIAPHGHAIRHEIRLPLADWEWMNPPDEFLLDMHIPAGGGMTPERCIDSFRRGVAFFREHFPDKTFRTIGCASWIFGPQLEDIFPASSNLVQLMREVYLLPISTYDTGGLWFIYFRNVIDPATVPRDTSVRRAVADYLASGGEWRVGGMTCLVDDLDRYGTEVYRSQWPKTREIAGIPN